MKDQSKSYFEGEENRSNIQGIKNWENQRAKGKWRFALKIGLLWSLMTFAGFILFEYFAFSKIRTEVLFFQALIFIVTGFIVGLIFWRIGERKYQKSISAKKKED